MFFYVDGDKVAGRGFKEATNKTGFQRGRSPLASNWCKPHFATNIRGQTTKMLTNLKR